MLDLRRTKVLRDLWRDRARTLLLVLAIAVGVAAYGLMFSGSIVLEKNLAEAFASSEPAHAVISVSPLDDALVQEVLALPEVAAAEPRRLILTRMEIAAGEWIPLAVFAYPAPDRLTLQKVFLEPGASYPAAGGEIVLERTLLEIADLETGQAVQVLDAAGEPVPVRISGFANDLFQLSTSMTRIAGGHASLAITDVLGEPAEYNQLLVRVDAFDDSPDSLHRAISVVVDHLEAAGSQVLFVEIPPPGKPLLGDNMTSILVILRSMGALTLGLSAFLVVNVISAFILRQAPQIGILKSIGGRPRQIGTMYAQQVIVLGLLAFALAVPLGLAGSYLFVDGAAAGMNFNVGRFFLPLEAVGLQAVSAVIVPLLAAAVPIYFGSRITIREALAGESGSPDVRPNPLTRLLNGRKGLSQVFRMSFLNTFRRQGRLALTLAALSLAGAMFIALLGVRIGLDASVRDGQRTQNYDVALDFAASYPAGEVAALAMEVDGVKEAEGWGVSAGRFELDGVLGGSFTLIGLPPDTRMVVPVFADGGWMDPAQPEGIVLTLEAWELAQQAGVGERLAAEIGAEIHAFELAGVGWRAFRPLAFIPYHRFEELTGRAGLVDRLVVVTDAHDSESQQAVLDRLEAAFEDAGYAQAGSVKTTDSRGSVSEQLDLFYIVLMSMVALIAVVGGLGLAITVSLNVIERTREIGVLRSLGASDRTVRAIVLRESLVVAVASWAIGALASVPLGVWLGNVLGMTISRRPLDYFFSVPGLFLWLALVVGIAYTAAVAPSQRAARLTIREALAYEG